MTVLGQMLYDDGKADGEIKGEIKGRVSLIRRKMEKGMEVSAIAEMLELEVDYVKMVERLLEENPEKTNLEVAEMIAK